MHMKIGNINVVIDNPDLLLAFIICLLIGLGALYYVLNKERDKPSMEKRETFGDLIRANLVYTKDGKRYRKLKRDEVIKEGAMQSWYHGELQPIKNSDGKTIGDTPSNFSPERDFYNPI